MSCDQNQKRGALRTPIARRECAFVRGLFHHADETVVQWARGCPDPGRPYAASVAEVDPDDDSIARWVAAHYRYDPDRQLLHCPILCLTGDRDPKVTVGEANAWSEHTTGGFTAHLFAGGHFFIATHAARINRLIAGFLESVLAGAGP